VFLFSHFHLWKIVLPRLLPRSAGKVHGKLADRMLATTYHAECWICEFANLGNKKRWVKALLSNVPFPSSKAVDLYNIATIGFYSSETFIPIALDRSRSDFWHFTFHHVITLELCTGTYLCGIVRLKVVGLVSHDFSYYFDI
jgi:hypothetical protein